MKVLYISPLFNNIDGKARKFMIEEAGIKTHRARDQAVIKMQTLGGIHAPDTPEVRKLMSAILRAKRKIEKNGWFASVVV